MNLVGNKLNVLPSVIGTAHSLNTFGYYCLISIDRGGEGTLKPLTFLWDGVAMWYKLL